MGYERKIWPVRSATSLVFRHVEHSERRLEQRCRLRNWMTTFLVETLTQHYLIAEGRRACWSRCPAYRFPTASSDRHTSARV
jgi:hypothetical protein